MVYQKYCEAMMDLSFAILELLAISLGVDRKLYRKFFEDGFSILRCNFYPPCQEPGLILGTGPHRDPTSLTILHQDQVGGLEVFSDNVWQTVRPRQSALVINIGDTFMVGI
jgi:gibberellin 20-oxidase